MNLIKYIQRQKSFSEQTFGPGDRTIGVTKHVAKELNEIVDDYNAWKPTLGEWVDVFILALEGMWRTGASPQEIVKAINAKMSKNERRRWPNWREKSADEPIEHVRGEHG